MTFLSGFLAGFTLDRAILFALCCVAIWFPVFRRSLPARLALTLAALVFMRFSVWQEGYFAGRAALLALWSVGIWLPGFRRSPATRRDLTLAALLAVATWAPILLALGAGATALLAAVALLRRRYGAFDGFLARAVTDIPTADALPQPSEAVGASRWTSMLWWGGGFLLLCAALAILEFRQPYYFCQDDMLVGETPGMLQSLRSIWQGVFPEWAGQIFMGVPSASAGGRLFYPPTYLAYAIARHVLGNELAQIDVSAILHIAAGYFVLYWVLRRLGASPALAAIGSLSVALSGSTLVMGRCWAMFIYGTVWTPLLMYAVVRLAKAPVGPAWVLLTGAGIGMLFQIGFVQLWVTVLLLMGIAAVYFWFTQLMPTGRFLWFAAAVLLGTALAAPLMYQQWLLTRDMMMIPRSDNGVGVGLLAMLLPYPLAKARHPLGWGGLESQYMGEMYYFGTTFALFLLLGLAALLTGRGGRWAWGANPWAALALLVLVLALGNDAGVWRVMSALPLLNIVNHYPFRMLPFLTLFAVLGGARVAERLLRGNPHRGWWEVALVLPTAGLMLWHVGFARSSFYQYGFRPTLPLPAAMAEVLHPNDPHPRARLMCWAPERSCLPEFRYTMKLNLPMLDGLLSFYGYDPLTSAKPTWQRAATVMQEDPLVASRIYGVRWHVFSRLIANPTYSSDSPVETYLESVVPLEEGFRKLRHVPMRVAAKLPEVTIADIGPVDPLAFPEGHPERPLPLTISGSGIDVDTSGVPELQNGGNVVVNWLWYPPMRASAGRLEAPCAADQWGRIVVSLPVTSTGALHVRYAPDWGTGVKIGAAFAALSLLGTALLHRFGEGASNSSARVDRAVFEPGKKKNSKKARAPAARRTARVAAARTTGRVQEPSQRSGPRRS